MPQIPDLHPSTKEDFALYTGPASPRFFPALSGITFPDPSYEIRRQHSECYVFEYVLEGKGYIRQGEESFLLERGDAYILHEREFHHYFSDKKDPWKKIWFNVSGSLVRHLLSDYGLETYVKIPAFGDDRYLQDIFHTMKNFQASRNPDADLVSPHRGIVSPADNFSQTPHGTKKEPAPLAEELALLLHQYIQELSRFVGQQAAGPGHALALKNYIEQNLMLPLSIEDMADHVHLSRSRTIHLFKEAYGITPYHYYLNQKAELARTLLKGTTLSVQEISERLGFSDYHHFSGFFRKWCGVPPSRYR